MSEIVEDSRSIPFKKLKTDFKYYDFNIELKASNADNRIIYISDNQLRSIKQGFSFNHFYIWMNYTAIEDSIAYKYSPRFIIDSQRIMQYIEPLKNKSKYSSNHLNYSNAASDGFCEIF